MRKFQLFRNTNIFLVQKVEIANLFSQSSNSVPLRGKKVNPTFNEINKNKKPICKISPASRGMWSNNHQCNMHEFIIFSRSSNLGFQNRSCSLINRRPFGLNFGIVFNSYTSIGINGLSSAM